jgi:hypothetical protein
MWPEHSLLLPWKAHGRARDFRQFLQQFFVNRKFFETPAFGKPTYDVVSYGLGVGLLHTSPKVTVWIWNWAYVCACKTYFILKLNCSKHTYVTGPIKLTLNWSSLNQMLSFQLNCSQFNFKLIFHCCSNR